MQLKIQEVAKLLGVSNKTIYRWIKDNAIPAYRVHDQYRVDRTELLEWVTARKIPVAKEIFEEPGNAESPIHLAATLEQGGIHYRVEGHDKPSVLRHIVDSMRLPQEVDREFLYHVLLAREKACSTAIGDGLAIPHPRNPIILHVTAPSVTLSFLEHPVEFGAMDNIPVRALFTVVSPTLRAHLQILSRLAFALHDPAFKSAISEPATREAILKEVRRLDAVLDERMQAAR